MKATRAKRSPTKGNLADLKRWTQRVTKGQKESACFLELWSDKLREDPSKEPISLMQLGYAMILDRPIVIVAPMGSNVPENIRRVARAVEFFHPDDEQSLQSATLRALQAAGMPIPH